jgi:hypothetical protein
MADRRPLVLANDPTVISADNQPVVQQLQRGDDLDIPLAERVAVLERRLKMVVETLSEQGFLLPIELTEQLTESEL